MGRTAYLCSIGPIMMVMLLGSFYHPTEATYTPVEIAEIGTTQDVVRQMLRALPQYMREVFLSVLPIAAVFLVFQLVTRIYRRHQPLRMCVGLADTLIGLILFRTGVNVGFTPVGNLLGSALAAGPLKLSLIPIGILVDYYIVKAEPAVQVLNQQVEEVSSGNERGAALFLYENQPRRF